MDHDFWISLYERDEWKCPCGEPSSQIAHRIPNSKFGRKFVRGVLLEQLGFVLATKDAGNIQVHTLPPRMLHDR